jgi:hypothetical protein
MRIRAILASTTTAVLLAVPFGVPAAVSSPAPAAKAGKYDKYCKGQSKRHARGHASNFGRCVSAMRKVDSGKVHTARAACRGLSKKKSGKLSPYTRCVRGVSKLHADRRGGDEQYADPFGN